MSEVGAVGVRRHFSSEEEEALRRGEGTSAIVQRDTTIGVDIHGSDPTRRQVADRQKEHWGLCGGGSLTHAVVDGLHLAEIHALEKVLGAGGAFVMIGGSLAGFALGAHELLEARANGKEQGEAITREQAHVAVLGALDLPAGYKGARLDKDFKEVPRGFQSTSFRMTEAIVKDKPGLAALQLQCDRGMNAARDLAQSGLGREAFLAANPKVAEAYAKDAAFHEGFDAYGFTRASGNPKQLEALDRKLEERDGWYAQSQIAFRV
jgi:hypothetical protein